MDNWIIFDVDDVLSNYRQSMYESFLKYGKDVHWSKWNTYNQCEIYGFKNQKMLHSYLTKNKILENSKIEYGVFSALKRLKRSGYKVGLLTARSWHKNGLDVTVSFVKKHNLNIDQIELSGFFEDKKSNHLDKFKGKICGFLDDNAHNVIDMKNNGVKDSFLLTRPWNVNSDVDRVKSLNEFILKIQSQ